MTIHFDEALPLLAELCEERQLRATAREALKAGLITGATAILGGLLLGRYGVALGGVIGGTASALAADDFKPLAVILMEMTPEQKRKLALRFSNVFRDFGIDDVIGLTMLLAKSTSFQDVAIREITNYLTKEMSMRIAS